MEPCVVLLCLSCPYRTAHLPLWFYPLSSAGTSEGSGFGRVPMSLTAISMSLMRTLRGENQLQ